MTERAQGPGPSPAEDLEVRRLRWRCRRGMKELDVLFERYAQQGLAAAGVRERRAFAQLLSLPDPELAGYLLGGLTPPGSELAQMVERIRSLCRWRAPVGAILPAATGQRLHAELSQRVTVYSSRSRATLIRELEGVHERRCK